MREMRGLFILFLGYYYVLNSIFHLSIYPFECLGTIIGGSWEDSMRINREDDEEGENVYDGVNYLFVWKGDWEGGWLGEEEGRWKGEAG
jgi:hypothetical protein